MIILEEQGLKKRFVRPQGFLTMHMNDASFMAHNVGFPADIIEPFTFCPKKNRSQKVMGMGELRFELR